MKERVNVCFFGNRIVSISQLGVRAPCFPLFVWCLQTIPPQQGMHRYPSDMDLRMSEERDAVTRPG